MDNVAATHTHGIKVEGSYPSKVTGEHCSLTIESSLFAQSSYVTKPTQAITGSYVLIDKSATRAGSSFKPRVTIRNSKFRLGHAKLGGAIFVNGVDKISLLLSGSRFENNVADLNGGAIFLDNLDDYAVDVSGSEFVYNSCRLYGDNVFVRQTKSTKNSVPTAKRMLDALPPTKKATATRQVVINETKFTTPMAGNQLYLDAIETVVLNKLQFNPIQDSQAIEGGSIYCLDCYSLSLTNSTFDR